MGTVGFRIQGSGHFKLSTDAFMIVQSVFHGFYVSI